VFPEPDLDMRTIAAGHFPGQRRDTFTAETGCKSRSFS
jgi:hypothetical protein